MNARRMVEHREMFMGEELVYHVQVIDPCPAPSEVNPYAPDGRAATVRTVDQPLPVATVKHRPSKAEFIRSFESEARGHYPACVWETTARVYAEFGGIVARFVQVRTMMSRRLRRALRRFDGSELAGFYNSGTLARIRWYYARHLARENRPVRGLSPASV